VCSQKSKIIDEIMNEKIDEIMNEKIDEKIKYHERSNDNEV